MGMPGGRGTMGMPGGRGLWVCLVVGDYGYAWW